MSAVVVEESEDVRSIVTPDLRLRFRRSGDRWSHAIDIRPGPWQTAASAVEWPADDPSGVPGPTYQELHFQRDRDGVVALAVGQAGSHHFSASFRVSYRSWRRVHFRRDDILQDRSESLVDIDVADRCRSVGSAVEARYVVHEPPIDTFLGDSRDGDASAGFSRDWRSSVVWEANVEGNHDVFLRASREPSASRISILEHQEKGSWLVRIAPDQPPTTATSRFSYTWGHARVKAFHRPTDSGDEPPWNLPGAIPPTILKPL
ncbi:MAG TPA: hypothetical protein VF590_04080 [Isosphaeraceae bacterium]